MPKGLNISSICYNNFMRILGINPWIFDFAAYDFWLKPYGFLVILQFLQDNYSSVDFIDCMDRKINKDNFGRGKYYSEIIDKPAIFNDIMRRYKRYGITKEEFINKLKGKNPDLILITSSMTYWYEGVKEVMHIIRKYFPDKPVVLGGTYATLMNEHARKTLKPDYIYSSTELDKLFNMFNIQFAPSQLYSTLPEYDNFYSSLDYVVLRTSWGCPFDCSYCAIKSLQDGFFTVKEEKIVNYVLNYYSKGIRDFVFYDDALFYKKDHIKRILKAIHKSKIRARFHTPNALHLRFLDDELAVLLKETGFVHPHFGLETLDTKLQKLWQNKVDTKDLMRGIKILKKAGFRNGEFCFYLLLGYPGQNLDNLRKEVQHLHKKGAFISLAEFSPTPKTKIFTFYEKKLENPLLHNNSIFDFFGHKRIKEIWELKNYVRRLNREWE